MENEGANQPDNGEKEKPKHTGAAVFSITFLVGAIVLSILSAPQHHGDMDELVIMALIAFLIGGIGALASLFTEEVPVEWKAFILVALAVACVTMLYTCSVAMPR